MAPTEPMTLASAGALRSGRNTRKCSIAPRSTAMSRPKKMGQKRAPEPRHGLEAFVLTEMSTGKIAEVEGLEEPELGDGVEPREPDVAFERELGPRVRRVHRNRAVREVDDTGALVGRPRCPIRASRKARRHPRPLKTASNNWSMLDFYPLCHPRNSCKPAD